MDFKTSTLNALNTLVHKLVTVVLGPMEKLIGKVAAKPALKLNWKSTLPLTFQVNLLMIKMVTGTSSNQLQFQLLIPPNKDVLHLTTTLSVQNL
jgi:hypothetical protein